MAPRTTITPAGVKKQENIAPPLETVDTSQTPTIDEIAPQYPGETGSRPMGPKRVENIAPPLKTVDTQGLPPESTAQKSQYAYDPTEDPTTEKSREFNPTDRIPAGEIIYVRNNTRSTVRFVDSPKPAEAKFNVVLQPAGAPDSIVSLDTFTVLRNPGFQKWWRAGKLTVTSNSEIQPLPVDISDIEIERHQQFALNGTLERTMPGSLPLPKNVDMSFLDDQKPKK